MSALLPLILQRIAADGPMSIAEYMALCLGHPEHGYYTTRDPLGRGGDFTTAPEISQMFGELIGLWLAQAWMDRGSPTVFTLAELGPGRGTLMADILRATSRIEGFNEAAKLHLVETSPTLRRKQWEALAAHEPAWTDQIDDLPAAPLFLVANEFFDALPIRQFQIEDNALRERMVGIEGGGLTIGLSPSLSTREGIPDTAAEGMIYETCPKGRAIARHIGERLHGHGGATLFIDYGHAEQGASGDTFQAVQDHAYADPLAAPGEADLTAHVDFTALSKAAEEGGAKAWGTHTQGALLEWLGIRVRAAMLAKRQPERQAEIDTALERLISPKAMGSLFKALALSGDETPPPGFAEDMGI